MQQARLSKLGKDALTGDIKKIAMKKLLKLIVVFVCTNIIYAQETKLSNTIIYIEAFGGFTVISDGGFGGGFELNYQNKKDLLRLWKSQDI